MIKQLSREVPGVSLLLLVLFGFSLFGFFTATSFDPSLSSQVAINDGMLSLVPVDAKAALRVENIKSREVLAVATSIAYKAKEMQKNLSSEDLAKAVQVAFDDEKLEVSSMVDFATLLREMNTRMDAAAQMKWGLQISTDE